MIKASVLLTCILASFLLAAVPASALQVVGAIFEAEAFPGQHVSHEMIVSSGVTEPSMNISAEVLGFGRTLECSNVELKAELDTSPYTARPFLGVSPASFRLEPGGSQHVFVEGEIPLDAEGGRYALINIHSLPEGDGPVGAVVAINVPVRLTIAGTELVKTGEITSLILDNPISRKELNVSLIFKNTGNYHYAAFAEGVLTDKKGSILASSSTPLSPCPIIPTTSMLFKMTLNPKKPLRPGIYNITATMSLEDGTTLARKEETFSI